jgi:uncharacterized protein (UPF0264 family)
MTQLLVSVRNATEAEAALRGGAGLIDVKEPANGPLGRADDEVIADVVRAVAGRVPVSATGGEWKDRNVCPLSAWQGLTFVKLGLAGLGGTDWRGPLAAAFWDNMARHDVRATLVVAAYADWELADAPRVEEVWAYSRAQPQGTFLLDTYDKNGGRTLLDCLPVERLALWGRLCRAAGVRTTLSGSLGPEQIARLLPLRPDWIAVRGAACEGGRDGVVSETKVRELAALVRSSGRGG